MRKSIKRIVSSILAATMVLTGSIVNTMVTTTAAPSGTVDSFVADSLEAVTISENTYAGNNKFLLLAKASVNTGAPSPSTGTVAVDKNDKTFPSGEIYAQRFKFGGSALTAEGEGVPSARAIVFEATAAGTLTVDALSSSSADVRQLDLVNAETGTVVSSISAYGAISGLPGVQTMDIPGAGVYYLTSNKEIGGGINIYGIYSTVELKANPVLPEVSAPTEATTEATTEAPTEATTEAPISAPTGPFVGQAVVSAKDAATALNGSALPDGTVLGEGVYTYTPGKTCSNKSQLTEGNTFASEDGVTYTMYFQLGKGNSTIPTTLAKGDKITGIIEKSINVNAGGSGTVKFYAGIGSGGVTETPLYLINTATNEIVDAVVMTKDASSSVNSIPEFTIPYAGIFAIVCPDNSSSLNVSQLELDITAGPAPVETTTEATTEATTVAPTTEATTEAPTAAAGEVLVTPSYKIDGENVVVDYNVSVGEGAKFNNYTLFLTFDPAVLTPVSAADGEIAIAATDAAGASISVPASNAANIETQFTNAPKSDNTDFEGADGVKTQAELGKIKVAYCIFDKDFSQAAGSLPAFNASGKLFTVTYKITGDVNGSKLAAAIQTMNSVSADTTVQSTPVSAGGEVTITGYTAPETTTETTTSTAPTPAGFSIKGDKPETVAGGNATVKFSLANTPDSGIASYTVIVKFDPTKLTITGGTTPGFDYDSNVVANQMAYVPVNDSDYGVDATNTKTAAELGIIKIAALKTSGSVTGSADVLTLDFKADASLTPGEYPVDITVIKTGDENTNLIDCTGVAGAVVIKSSTPGDDTTTEATTEATSEATTDKVTEATTAEATETTTRRPSSGGGGGHKATTTTEATTEATTKSTNVEGNGETTTIEVIISIPTDKNPDFEGFIDIDNYPWAKDSINKLAELGIVSGIGDRLYGPALPCRRCDFAILINRTLGVTVSATPKNFYDNEDQSKYYYNDCLVGYNAGILSGYGNNYYKPEQYCTREEMAVLIAKSFEWLGNDVTSTDLAVNNKYTDVDNISWWSAPYVAYLTDKGILNGNTNGTLLPQNFINRAEMAVMMSKVYDYALELVNGGTDLDLTEVRG